VAAVFDWDSVAARPEPAIAGAAAAVYPSAGSTVAASLDQTEAFLDAYQAARGQPFTVAERQLAWAAGTWVLVYNAKKESVRASSGPYQRHLSADVGRRLAKAAA
jgi:hypothetical protein